MKKFITVVVLSLVSLFAVAGDIKIPSEAWDQVRALHARYLGDIVNRTPPAQTDAWMINDMIPWHDGLQQKNKDLEAENVSLKAENVSLEAENASLEAENASLKEELEFSKMLNSIAYSIIAVILFGAVGFILIKKSQAKKLPQKIKAVIADQTK